MTGPVEEIKTLITRAADAPLGVEAMQFSQAASNAANALHTLRRISKLSLAIRRNSSP